MKEEYEHDEDCRCIECETCFHCGKQLGIGSNECSHCLNEEDVTKKQSIKFEGG